LEQQLGRKRGIVEYEILSIVGAALRDAGTPKDFCPRVSLRYALGYFRVLPPGE
jgi:hypothetical protein